MIVRTAKQALGLVRQHRLVPMTAVPGFTSLVEAVAGGRVRGSWWGHPKGALMYELANALHDSPEVLHVRLLDAKGTFVHRALWPALYRVVSDPSWRRSASRDLTAAERRLLRSVERGGEIRPGKVKHRLTEKLLVLAWNVHTLDGHHESVLSSWDRWAKAPLNRAAKRLAFEAAVEELRAACKGHAPALPT